MRVIDSYGTVVLDALKMTWANVIEMEPQPQKTESSLSLLGIADETDPVPEIMGSYSALLRTP